MPRRRFTLLLLLRAMPSELQLLYDDHTFKIVQLQVQTIEQRFVELYAAIMYNVHRRFTQTICHTSTFCIAQEHGAHMLTHMLSMTSWV